MLDLQFAQKEESVPLTSEFRLLPRVNPKKLCVLAHLGCTNKVGIFQLMSKYEVDKQIFNISQWDTLFCPVKDNEFQSPLHSNIYNPELQSLRCYGVLPTNELINNL